MHLKLDLFKLQYYGEVDPHGHLLFPGRVREIFCFSALPKYERDKRMVLNCGMSETIPVSGYQWHMPTHEDDWSYERLKGTYKLMTEMHEAYPIILIPDIEDWLDSEEMDNASESPDDSEKYNQICLERISADCPKALIIAGS